MADLDIDSVVADLLQWVGRKEINEETLTPEPLMRLAALFDTRMPCPQHGDPIPPMWHWAYFLPTTPQSELGPDGHPRRGSFMPPVPLARRMFAGGRATLHSPLRVGEHVTRTATIEDIRGTRGRSGSLIFVTVRLEYRTTRGPSVVEEQDIVYTDLQKSVRRNPSESRPLLPWQLTLHPDPLLLFRFAALTFNAHRIHFDREYATHVEGYAGLVVQGPLIALALLELVRQHADHRSVAEFSFRARAPLLEGEEISLEGGPQAEGSGAAIYAYTAEGIRAMEVSVSFARTGAET